MATLRIRIKGTLGQISATSLVSVLRRSLDVLHDLDLRLSEEYGGSLRWVIAGVGEGSLYVDLGTRIKKGDHDFGQRVHDTFTNGLQVIMDQGITPPYFSVKNVESIGQIIRDIGRDGMNAVEYLEPTHPESTAELTTDVEPTILKLVGVSYHALGSIEGKVELVSIQKRRRRFNVTLERTRKAVTCNLPTELEDPIMEAMKQHRRVLVNGRIAYNALGEPIRVDVQGAIRLLGEPKDLPTSEELAGSDPDLTGSMSTEDYVRSLRDG